jgi:mannose/cellobiose epimerase-like protein (N-acyl-D-glucosamine 2-epimerase family)
VKKHFDNQLDGMAGSLAEGSAGFSRRKALKLLAGGAAGGLLAEVVQGEAHAQSIYLPNLSNGTESAPEEETPCSNDQECVVASAIDFSWFKSHLVNSILPKWLTAVTPQGLFLPHFDRQWRPLKRNFGTLVSQGRLLYNFAQGFALTGDTRYRDAVAGGAHYLLDHFRDTKNGGWYWACNLDGTIRDKSKNSYGHAFVIFGLAHAYKCTGNRAFQDAMLQAWNVMTGRFRDSAGGFYELMSEDFKPSGTTKTQNPLMHTFEALLAASSVGGQAQLKQEAIPIGDFVFDKLLRPSDRRLPEVYDLTWKELSANNGGKLELGHLFEWAYLAAYGAEVGLPARYLNFAESLLMVGMGLGFDWENGGLFSPAAPNGVLINQEKNWWQQCETIRTLLYFYMRRQRSDLGGLVQRTINFVKANFVDQQYGGWYPRIGPGIDPKSLEKGNEWKVDYHVVGMCMEAIRLAPKLNS